MPADHWSGGVIDHNREQQLANINNTYLFQRLKDWGEPGLPLIWKP